MKRLLANAHEALNGFAFHCAIIAVSCGLFVASAVYGSGGIMAGQLWYVANTGALAAFTGLAAVFAAVAGTAGLVDAGVPVYASTLRPHATFSPRAETAPETAEVAAGSPFDLVPLPETPPPAASVPAELPPAPTTPLPPAFAEQATEQQPTTLRN